MDVHKTMEDDVLLFDRVVTRAMERGKFAAEYEHSNDDRMIGMYLTAIPNTGCCFETGYVSKEWRVFSYVNLKIGLNSLPCGIQADRKDGHLSINLTAAEAIFEMAKQHDLITHDEYVQMAAYITRMKGM